MSKDGRKTSKLAIAGMTIAVAVPCLFFISALALARFYEELNGALIIFMLLLLLLPFAAFPLSIAGLIITIAKKKKGRAAAITGLVLSVAEILFVIVTAGAFFAYEKKPGHSLDIVPPYIGTSAPTETSETVDRMRISTSGTKQLTLDDVIELSSKGDELVWEDLADYIGYETGSGLYIVTFDIDDNYTLIVGGTGAVGKPSYAHLTYNDDDYIDIRTEDVEAFIAENS
jgi:hypothetical protein